MSNSLFIIIMEIAMDGFSLQYQKWELGTKETPLDVEGCLDQNQTL
jgi:hypothetical protein